MGNGCNGDEDETLAVQDVLFRHNYRANRNKWITNACDEKMNKNEKFCQVVLYVQNERNLAVLTRGSSLSGCYATAEHSIKGSGLSEEIRAFLSNRFAIKCIVEVVFLHIIGSELKSLPRVRRGGTGRV